MNYAQLQKHYGSKGSTEPTGRYSPAKLSSITKEVIRGNPDERHISTGYIERQNLTMRMSMRRFTRLTNGFSKKLDNHCAAVALHFLHYNFCRIHKTLRVTPAMEAGLAPLLQLKAMDRHNHWERVYGTKGERDVSWFQESPAISLKLIESAGLRLDTCVLDIGGGDSRLVDTLLTKGVGCVCVLDIAGSALTRAQARLGPESQRVCWIVADVTGQWAAKPVDIWHDRAVFHFLTNSIERESYLTQLRRHLKPGGSAIIGTFDLDGPETCSGLSVARYSPKMLQDTLGPKFALVESVQHDHVTPSGRVQPFQYSRFIYAGPSD